LYSSVQQKDEIFSISSTLLALKWIKSKILLIFSPLTPSSSFNVATKFSSPILFTLSIRFDIFFACSSSFAILHKKALINFLLLMWNTNSSCNSQASMISSSVFHNVIMISAS
jgi:hypothetical protein